MDFHCQNRKKQNLESGSTTCKISQDKCLYFSIRQTLRKDALFLYIFVILDNITCLQCGFRVCSLEAYHVTTFGMLQQDVHHHSGGVAQYFSFFSRWMMSLKRVYLFRGSCKNALRQNLNRCGLFYTLESASLHKKILVCINTVVPFWKSPMMTH